MKNRAMDMGDRRGCSAASISIALHDLSPGGTERIAIRLANRWAQAGRSVRLICGTDEGALRGLVSPAIGVEVLQPRVCRGPGSRGRLARAVGAALVREPCDVLFLPGNFHLPVAACVTALPPPLRPSVVAQLSNALRRPGRGPAGQAIFEARTRWLMRSVSCAIALSDAARIEADEVLRRRLAIALPSPVLEDRVASPVPPPSGPPLVVAIGRLVEQKDFSLAIRAFAQVSAPDARLVILGEGAERPQLEKLVASLGLGRRVELAGYVADVRPWLDRARCLLLSSRYEGYPAVVVEALAAGRPIVATPCGGAMADLISTPQAGVIAERRTPQALAAALERQLAAPCPEPAALARQVAHHRMGPVSAAYLDAFDAARSAPPLEPLIQMNSQTLPGRAGDLEVLGLAPDVVGLAR
jgi:glycosyltransferase involved in cell wall biosynthesis